MYQREGVSQSLEAALNSLQKAIELEPNYWSPHFWHGTYSYYSGDIDGAIKSLQRAAQLHPAAITLTNFGTVALCQNKLELALRTFEEIEHRFPSNHLGPENLGTIHHFLGNFEKEITYRNKSLRLLGPDASPNIFQIYGALAEAHRLLGQGTEALKHYRKAVDLIQRDRVAQTDRPQDAIALALYQFRIAQLQDAPLNVGQESTRSLLGEFQPEALDPSANIWAAELALLNRQHTLSERYRAAALQRCPVYERHLTLSDHLEEHTQATDI